MSDARTPRTRKLQPGFSAVIAWFRASGPGLAAISQVLARRFEGDTTSCSARRS